MSIQPGIIGHLNGGRHCGRRIWVIDQVAADWHCVPARKIISGTTGRHSGSRQVVRSVGDVRHILFHNLSLSLAAIDIAAVSIKRDVVFQNLPFGAHGNVVGYIRQRTTGHLRAIDGPINESVSHPDGGDDRAQIKRAPVLDKTLLSCVEHAIAKMPRMRCRITISRIRVEGDYAYLGVPFCIHVGVGRYGSVERERRRKLAVGAPFHKCEAFLGGIFRSSNLIALGYLNRIQQRVPIPETHCSCCAKA